MLGSIRRSGDTRSRRSLAQSSCVGTYQGGVAQGIGASLFKELHYDRDGRVLNASLAAGH